MGLHYHYKTEFSQICEFHVILTLTLDCSMNNHPTGTYLYAFWRSCSLVAFEPITGPPAASGLKHQPIQNGTIFRISLLHQLWRLIALDWKNLQVPSLVIKKALSLLFRTSIIAFIEVEEIIMKTASILSQNRSKTAIFTLIRQQIVKNRLCSVKTPGVCKSCSLQVFGEKSREKDAKMN